MSDRQITIALDAMGGDDSPYKNLKGAELFILNKPNVKLIIFGDKNKIVNSIQSNNIKLNKYDIIHCVKMY